MKCDRCGEWHQRTVLTENDVADKPKQERLCLTCIAQLIYGRYTPPEQKFEDLPCGKFITEQKAFHKQALAEIKTLAETAAKINHKEAIKEE